MSKCKSCGADIIWIRTASGKNMPCDSKKIYYKPNITYGKLNLVLPNGKVTRGDFDLESDTFGYISHFATCPSAELHRKVQEKERQMAFTIADMRGED